MMEYRELNGSYGRMKEANYEKKEFHSGRAAHIHDGSAAYRCDPGMPHSGEVYPDEKYQILPDAFALLFTLIFFLYDVSCGNITFGKNKKPIVTGIPVYDIPQV